MNYKRQISKEDARKLFVEYENTRDIELRDILIERHLYIPQILSKKYGHKTGDNGDIFQVALLGLIHAVDRFDPSRGYEFDTFAVPTIIGEIKRHYQDPEYLIDISRKVQILNRKINQTRIMLEYKHLRPPTIFEIADHLKISVECIIESIESNNAKCLLSKTFISRKPNITNSQISS